MFMYVIHQSLLISKRMLNTNLMMLNDALLFTKTFLRYLLVLRYGGEMIHVGLIHCIVFDF